MSIQVETLADSISPDGHRLTSYLCRYPRVVHSELMTHRALSKNSASSRAIPIKKVIESVEQNPYIPERFGLAKKGMQPGSFVDESDEDYSGLVDWWLAARDKAVESANIGAKLGLHKQVVNRLLEPFQYITIVLSGTEWDNFIKLRTEVDEVGNPFADLPIFELASKIRDRLAVDQPEPLDFGQWHTPFAGGDGWTDLSQDDRLAVSAARCARTSYKASHILDSGVATEAESDLRLFKTLTTNGHFSPLEHVAMVSEEGSGNFKGYRQLRRYYE